jgi:Tol biopolymer transport system component
MMACGIYLGQPNMLADVVRSPVAAVSAVAYARAAEEQAAPRRGHSRVSGRTVALLPAGASDTLVVNPGRHGVAYVARADDTEFVVFDRREGRRYTKVGSPTFSSDGRRLAYVARQGGKALVVADGEEGKHYDRIDAGPLFSPDGKRLAYVASTGKQSFLVVDGQEGPPSESSDTNDHSVTFSGDGLRVARKATAGGKQFVMLSDGPQRTHDVVVGRSIAFAPRFNRLAYIAREGNEAFVVEEGRSWKRHPDVVRGPVFASNGTRLAYVASEGFLRQFVVVDGIQEKRYDEITYGPVFSPDGKRFAYTARLGQSEFVIVDGQERGRYWSVKYGPLFSPDSQRIAWTVQTVTEASGSGHHIVVDGKEHRRYRDVSLPVFSPDSRRVAYAARSGHMWFMVVDEHEGKQYVVGGRLFSNPLSDPIFSPDSRHVAYSAPKGTVVVDGVEGEAYDGILAARDGGIVFHAFNHLRYLVRKGNAVVLIDEFVE